jgi:hypothetical protein
VYNRLIYLHYSEVPEYTIVYSSGPWMHEAGPHAKQAAFGLILMKETFIKSCYSTNNFHTFLPTPNHALALALRFSFFDGSG